MKKDKIKEEYSDDELCADMVEKGFVVKMAPKKRYIIKARVVKIIRNFRGK